MVISRIGEDLEQHGGVALLTDKGGDALLHFFRVGSLQVVHMMLHADALSGGMMLGSYQLVAGRTLVEAWQHVEDAALAIVQQQDAQVAAQVLVPQGILVVEEAEVANDAEHLLVGDAREACCRAERALDAVDATVAPDRMPGIDIRQANSAAVGIMGER